MREIGDYLWGDDPDGGPENALNYVAKRVDIMRNGAYRQKPGDMPMLPWLGCTVTACYNRGFILDFLPVDSKAKAVA